MAVGKTLLPPTETQGSEYRGKARVVARCLRVVIIVEE